MTVTGQLKYTERAFAQDADLAMGSDIVRALIELITNADDAYGASTGEIIVTVDTRGDHPLVRVADTARGLSPQQLAEAFGELGGRVSGFHEGAEVRGLFGRGAKDTAAFGRTVFESIRDDRYGRFEIRRDSTWTLDEDSARDSHRADLGIPPGASGLTATIHVERQGIAIPSHAVLAERLRDHVQLRGLNQRQTVILRRFTNGPTAHSDVVRWSPPDATLVHDDDITVVGYGVPARLRLWRLGRAADTGLNPYSIHGIAVRGGRGTYENTLFGATAAEATWIRGELVCPHIDQLIRTYDEDDVDEANPEPLLRRDRTGLNGEHPFHRALTSSVLDVLAPLLEAMRPERPAAAGGAELQGGLDRAAQALAMLLRADLQDLEEQAGGGVAPDADSPILIIPPRLRVRKGDRRIVSVVLDHAQLGEDTSVEMLSTDPAVLRVESVGEPATYTDHHDASIRSVAVVALDLGRANLVARHPSGRTAACDVSVHEDPRIEVEPPTGLEWMTDSFNVTKGRSRTLLLRAPVELGPEGRLRCTVAVEDGDCIDLPEADATLRLVREGWLEARVKVRGLVIGSARIVARTATDAAEATARVTAPTGLGGLGARVAIVDEQQGRLRGRLTLEDDGYLVTVLKRHPGLDGLLGRPNVDGSFERENLPDARVGVAEAVASVVADWLVGKEAEKYPHLYTDASAIIDLRNRQVFRYLPAIKSALEMQRE